MGLFGVADGWTGKPASPPLLKICYSYPIMKKLGSYTLHKKDPKYMNHMTHSLSSAGICIF